MNDYERKVKDLLDFYKAENVEIKFCLVSDKSKEIKGKVRGIKFFFLSSPYVVINVADTTPMKVYLNDIIVSSIVPAAIETGPNVIRILRTAIPLRKRLDIFRRDNFTCSYCGNFFPVSQLEADHVTPVCQGGTDEDSNLTTACINCNRSKGGS
jgi:hypothetical protein